MELAVLSFGLARSNSLFSLSMLDFVHLEVSLSSHSLCQLGSAMSALNHVHLEATPSPKELARLDFVLLMLDHTHLGLIPLFRSTA